MTTPQLEHGYVRIANELLDAILAFDFSKRELAVMFAVVRKTYGYNKKVDAVSIWQLSQMTGLDRANVSRTVATLIKRKVLFESGEGRMSHGQMIPAIGLNKKYSEWLTVAEIAPVPKQHRCQNSNETDAKTAKQPMPKRQLQKTTTKDNPKDIYASEFEQDIKPWYPKRAGGYNWPAAERQYAARRKEGFTLEEIQFGTIRYAKYCEAEGMLRTKFVKQASTFYGPDKHFQELWEASDETDRNLSPADRVRRANGL